MSMKFIEFIKPNSKKLFLTAILPSILTSILLFFLLFIGLLPDNIQEMIGLKFMSVYFVSILYIPLFVVFVYFSWMPFYIALPVAVLAAILPWYLFSCLIIYSWNKIFGSHFIYNKLQNYLLKWEEMNYNLDLFGRIAIIGLSSSFIHAIILGEIGSNSAIFRIPTVLFAINSGILIGLVIFVLIQKIGHVRFQNKRKINIFCIFLAIAIILPAITEYYITVPPAEILKKWNCTGPHELCIEVDSLRLWYDNTYTWKSGEFGIQNATHVPMYELREFTWQFDRLSKEITLYESDEKKYYIPKINGWKIKLKLEVTVDKEYYNMITYYINSSGKTPINPKLFDGVTWTTSPYVVRGPYYKDNESSITYILPPGSTPPGNNE